MIGKGSERGSGISTLMTRHDDDEMMAAQVWQAYAAVV